MRRRRAALGGVEPPGRLVTFDPAEWLPLVDPSEYDPADYLAVRDRQPHGEPWLSFENWRRQHAHTLWMHARVAWCEEFGWPDGSGTVALIVEAAHTPVDGSAGAQP
jgi:hypothetical protein